MTISRKVIVHIGLEKTGTTSIQRALLAATDALLAQGIHFDTFFGSTVAGSRGNSVGLVLAAQSPQRRRWRDAAAPAVAASFDDYQMRPDDPAGAVQTLLFSAEHLSSQLTDLEEIRRLKAFLDTLGSEIRIVVYLRRHDRLADSLVNEYIKAGGVFHLRDRGAVVDRILKGGKLHYGKVIGRYVDVFGRDSVVIRKFDKADLIAGDIVADFAATCGFRMPKAAATYANTSLSLEALYVLSILNDLRTQIGPSDAMAKARQAVIRNGAGKTRFLTASAARDLFAALARDIDTIETITGGPVFDHETADYSDTPDDISMPALGRLLHLPEVAAVMRG